WDCYHKHLILGVHVQLLTVQLRQLGVGGLDVVQVLDGLPEGGENLLAMGTDLGVPDDGCGAGQVPEGGEEPLCPGVDDEQPGLGSAFLHVDLAPEAGNELLLLGCPVHHGGGRRRTRTRGCAADPTQAFIPWSSSSPWGHWLGGAGGPCRGCSGCGV
uniref:Uncharacterized protein n=1 Tax=Melopsittacus undulatus TaxID=13146 RepID=A0A8V5FW87_MELUD